MATMKASWIPAATPPNSGRDVLVAYRKVPGSSRGMSCGAYHKNHRGGDWMVDGYGVDVEAVAWMDLPAMPEGI